MRKKTTPYREGTIITNGAFDIYRKALAEYALDADEPFIDLKEELGPSPKMLSHDGLHTSAEGHGRIHDLVLPLVLKELVDN